MKTIGMNLKILENEFIEDNSHCHLCSADMQGPCAFPFRQWMACALALDDSDSNPNLMPNLTHGQCQGSLNRYMFRNNIQLFLYFICFTFELSVTVNAAMITLPVIQTKDQCYFHGISGVKERKWRIVHVLFIARNSILFWEEHIS